MDLSRRVLGCFKLALIPSCGRARLSAGPLRYDGRAQGLHVARRFEALLAKLIYRPSCSDSVRGRIQNRLIVRSLDCFGMEMVLLLEIHLYQRYPFVDRMAEQLPDVVKLVLIF